MRVLILAGPTAAGKSAAAVAVAERYGARLVSADAMTVYRGMDIGTAKPPPEVLAVHPHACVDVRDPDGDFTVADFEAATRAAVAAGGPVVVVGGTPFYLAALVSPLPPLPAGDPTVRAALEALDDPHARLQVEDPELAARLHPHDRVRVIRALEVMALSGEKMSVLQAAAPRRPALAAEVVWLDPEDGLRARMADRLERMVAAGYVEEAEALLQAGWGAHLKPMKSFAYRHIVAHIQGEISLDEAIRCTERDTWRLARKQRNWARAMGWVSAGASAVLTAAARAFGA